MNAKDIAAYLKISVSQAYALLSSESFPTLHIGNRKLVTLNNLNEWMLKNTNVI
ncbi:MAG: helix-turn-helix domain-containing protein [Clostridia bacterium]|nr:helix-turn-helix domain-containing protein [Clostridia bacterium]